MWGSLPPPLLREQPLDPEARGWVPPAQCQVTPTSWPADPQDWPVRFSLSCIWTCKFTSGCGWDCQSIEAGHILALKSLWVTLNPYHSAAQSDLWFSASMVLPSGTVWGLGCHNNMGRNVSDNSWVQPWGLDSLHKGLFSVPHNFWMNHKTFPHVKSLCKYFSLEPFFCMYHKHKTIFASL